MIKNSHKDKKITCTNCANVCFLILTELATVKIDFHTVISDRRICQNSGTVVAGINNVTCQCAAFFAGYRCHIGTV